MNISLFIVERFAEISTIALHIYFLYRTLDAKVGRKKQIIAGAIFIGIRMAYYILGFPYRRYFSVAAGIIYASFVFKGKFRSYGIWTIIPVVLDGIVETAIISLYLLLPNTFSEQVDSFGLVRIAMIFTARITLFIVYYFITRRVDKSHTMNWRDCFPLLIVSTGCWVLLELIFQFNKALISTSPLLASGNIILLLVMASVISLYNWLTVNGKELAQSKLQLRTAEMTQDHISQIQDIYLKLSAVRHDLNGHFSAISGYLNAKDYNALEQYIGNLTGFDIGTQEYAKHPVLNALINSKAKIAQNLNMNFTAHIEMPDNLPISDVELCILVSNVLDNAFEANKKAVEPHFIDLCTRVVNSYWVIACRNATYKKGRFRAAGSLKSTKEDTGIHGIGTKQIQNIAEESGGFVTYRHENYEFTTLVMIKLSK
ncbi:GHKL domain-containing protein [Lacrimispora brassicae]